MEFSQEVISSVSQCTENTVIVKQEPDDENVFVVQNNSDALVNERYIATTMAFTEEMPAITDMIENVDIKEEFIEDSSSDSRQEFVFVACADNAFLNELKLEEQYADLNEGNICHSSPEETEKSNEICPYCNEMYTAHSIDAHKDTCNLKFAYSCTLCPEVLMHKNLIENHVLTHASTLNGRSVDEIVQKIELKALEDSMLQRKPEAEGPEKNVESCPHCRKMFTSSFINEHKAICDSKFAYSCTLCPTVLMHEHLIENHVQTHGNALNGKSVNEIVQEIITKKKERKAYTPEEIMLRRKSDLDKSKNSDQLCPYCKKYYSRRFLNLHKANCDKNFVYTCTICPTVLLRKSLIKRHVNEHRNSLSGKIEKEVVEQIIKRRIIVDAENLHANINNPVVNESQFPLIFPGTSSTHQQKSVSIDNIRKITTTAKKQKGEVVNPAKKQKLDLQNKSQELIKDCASTSQKSNFPLTVINEKINFPTEVNTQSRTVLTKKPGLLFQLLSSKKINEKYVYCNECDYKTYRKSYLSTHIMTTHGLKLNLIRFECFKCKKYFSDMNQWSDHEYKCKAKILYSCLFCPKILMLKKNMLSHISKQHVTQVAGKKLDEIERLIDSNKKIILGDSALMLAIKNPKLNIAIESNAQKSIDVDSNVALSKTNSIIASDMQNQSVIIEKDIAENQGSDLLPCNQCNYKSWSKGNLARHIQRCHILNPRVEKCRKCEKIFQNSEELKAHEADCKLAPYFFCPYCTKFLLAKRNMINHIQKKHNKEIEGKSADDIQRLVKTNKKIVDPSILNEQLTKQKSEEKLKLMKKSVSTSTSSEQLTKQKRTEKSKLKKSVNTSTLDEQLTKQKRKEKSKLKKSELEYFSCDHCNYQTKNKALLVCHHTKAHSAELNLEVFSATRRVRCKDCQQTMKENYLVPHSYSCQGKFDYTCTFCPKVYTRRDRIKAHVLAQHSNELSDKSIAEVMREIFSKKTKSKGFKKNTDAKKRIRKKAANADGTKEIVDIDPDEIDASTLEYVICYCIKCKIVRAIRNEVKPSRSRCQDCGQRIIYLCSKCKEMHSVVLPRLDKHWKECKQYNAVSQVVLDKLVMYRCSECKFLSTHKHRYAIHIARSKHKPMQDFNESNDQDGENADHGITDDMNIYKEEKFAIEPCVIDLRTMTHRYCPKCDITVTEEMQDREKVIKGKCKVCNTYFLPQCTKCNIKSDSWLNMRYHLSAKCFSGLYACIKCNHRAQNWNLMQKHYIRNHTNRVQAFLCEFCSFNSVHRTNFYTHLKKKHPKETEHIVLEKEYYNFKKMDDIDYKCDHCSFTSKHKNSVKVHLKLWHGKKKHKCELCKFKTRYHASLTRHIATRHKNYY